MSLNWLDAVPSAQRTALIASTFVALAAGTSMGLWSVSPAVHTALAVGLLLIIGGFWTAAWWRLARPELQRRATQAERAHQLRARDRGLLAAHIADHPSRGISGGLQGLQAADPGFALSVFLQRACDLFRATTPDVTIGPAEVTAVHLDDERTVATVTAKLLQNGSTRVVGFELSRKQGTASAPPESEQHGWRLGEVGDGDPASLRSADPANSTVVAARRALLQRDEAFDLEAFEAFVAEVNDLIDRFAIPQGDETLAELEPYCTPRGRETVHWWRQGPGVPQSSPQLIWLEVEEDGWYERIEIQSGQRILGLQRPSAQADAPWRLWRLRGAS